jgi:adenylyl-sulfate kinase
MSSRAIIFWFTGLSGVGKTTLANGLREALTEEGQQVLTLDGDDVRSRLHRHLGFSPEDIRLNNTLIAGLCEENRAGHDFILVPIISPYLDSRAAARCRLAPDFHEIHITADLEVLYARDTKGFYQAARENKMNNLIGVSANSPYEAPEFAELVIDSGTESAIQSSMRLFEYANLCLAQKHR